MRWRRTCKALAEIKRSDFSLDYQQHPDRDAEIIREIIVMIDELVPLRNAEPRRDDPLSLQSSDRQLNLLVSKLSDRHSCTFRCFVGLLPLNPESVRAILELK